MTMTCGLPMSSYLTFKGDLLQQKTGTMAFPWTIPPKLCVLAELKELNLLCGDCTTLDFPLYSNCFQSVFYSPCYKQKKTQQKWNHVQPDLFCIDWLDTNLNSEYNKSETTSFVLICLFDSSLLLEMFKCFAPIMGNFIIKELHLDKN